MTSFRSPIKIHSKRPLRKTREVAAGDDVNATKAAITELEQASHALAKTLEASAQAGAAAPEEATADAGNGSGDDVIDADFEVKDS